MGQVMHTIQVKLKNSSTGFFTFVVKLLSGTLLGLTFALMGQEIFGYEMFSFVLVVVVVSGLFLRKARNWGLMGVLIFNLICVLIGLLLRMYILIAPGA